MVLIKIYTYICTQLKNIVLLNFKRMKKFYVCLFTMLFVISFDVKAQLPDNSIAPDFVATDINGVEHRLYDYLEAGKTVIIDFFTVWCGPCWGYHEDGILEEAWALYGPEGTDELMIFQIEIEPTMGMDEMLGNGEYSQGNWLEGVEYPTIDDLIDTANTSMYLFGTVIGDAFQVMGVPNIVVICPSGFITNDYYPYMTAQELIDFSQNCQLATEDIDVALYQYIGDVLYCDDVLDQPKIVLQNLSLSTNQISANIQTIVNGNVVAEYAYTGELDLYKADTIELDPISDLGSSQTITFNVELEGDTYLDNNAKTIEVHRANFFDVTDVIVEVQPDDYPEDFSFIMEDGNGNLIYKCEGIPNSSIQTFEITIPENVCVVWKIFDEYGDGIINGYVKLLEANTNQELIVVDGNQFFESHTEKFTNINYTGIDEHETMKVDVFPNPTNDLLNISVSTEINSMEIINVLGQQVMNIPVTNTSEYQISIKQLPSGIYFLNVKGNNFIKTERILKN